MMYNYRKSRLESQNPIVVDFNGDSKSNIPQLIKGLAFLHTRFGNIDWEELVLPAAKLAKYVYIFLEPYMKTSIFFIKLITYEIFFTVQALMYPILWCWPLKESKIQICLDLSNLATN